MEVIRGSRFSLKSRSYSAEPILLEHLGQNGIRIRTHRAELDAAEQVPVHGRCT